MNALRTAAIYLVAFIIRTLIVLFWLAVGAVVLYLAFSTGGSPGQKQDFEDLRYEFEQDQHFPNE